MKSVTTFDNFPTFAENGSRNMNTESAKYQIGFVEADTFPAEWANYLFHGATKGVSDLNTAVQSIWQENINVITQSGQTPNPNSTNQLYTAIQTFINNAILSANASILAQAKLDAHPIGSLYWSSDPTDPSILFGGTWTRIKDRFVLAVGDRYGNGATGGAATVTLTESNLPAHTHNMNHNHTGSVSGSVGETDVDHKHDFSGTTSNMSGDTYGECRPQDFGFFTQGNNYRSGRFLEGGATSGHILGTQGKGYNLKINLSHTHDYSGTTGYSNNAKSSLNHSHTWSGSVTIDTETANTGSVGSGTAHENMPPYIVKYCWERTA